MTKLLDGGILCLRIGRKYKYEIKSAAMLIIFFPVSRFSWKKIPKFISPKITTGNTKFNNGTKGLLNTGYIECPNLNDFILVTDKLLISSYLLEELFICNFFFILFLSCYCKSFE